MAEEGCKKYCLHNKDLQKLADEANVDEYLSCKCSCYPFCDDQDEENRKRCKGGLVGCVCASCKKYAVCGVKHCCSKVGAGLNKDCRNLGTYIKTGCEKLKNCFKECCTGFCDKVVDAGKGC